MNPTVIQPPDKMLSRADRRRLRESTIRNRRRLGIVDPLEPVPLSDAIAELLDRLGIKPGGTR